MPMRMIREFFRYEAAGGILLGLAALTALIVKNSPLEPFYNTFLETPVTVRIGEFAIDKPLLLWINDGLMAIFFFLVGLEIKREVLQGQLSTRAQISLPAVAALGGIIAPALIYVMFNLNNEDPAALSGWAIPAATDIAFALGIITLLGNRVPEALKICLVAVAIIDDLAAIVIIALFYTSSLSLLSLGLAALAVVALAVLNKRGVTKAAPYIVIGVFLWACVLKSGVHATLAGVVLAFFIPLKKLNEDGKAPLLELEHGLHPWVAYMILPVFAFANAGVSLQGITLDVLMQPITLGIAAGLFFGKQIGVTLFTLLGMALRICRLPDGVSFKQYYGMALITGVGFTMSLFIGTLAFDDDAHQTAVRLGVLLGSFLSGVSGYLLLRFTCGARKTAEAQQTTSP